MPALCPPLARPAFAPATAFSPLMARWVRLGALVPTWRMRPSAETAAEKSARCYVVWVSE
eukprot:1424812-Alexandrium_andersonii.AAC.1